MTKKERYRRNLPHIQPIGGLFFITYNIKGSIPNQQMEKWTAEYDLRKMQITRSEKPDKEAQLDMLREEYFLKYNEYLDKQGEMHYFKDDRLAKVVANTLHFWDGNKLELFCNCIMSNHVHTVFQLYDKDSEGKVVYLDVILKSVKQYSASKCKKLLARKGPFWQEESYDRLIRDHDELYRIMEYILDNPVKAGLCQNRGDWKWSYIKEKYDEFI
jgi:REP element-mobilizing transposase RayT